MPTVKEALDLINEIESTIEEDVPEKAKINNAEYFESVLQKAKNIGSTVESHDVATAGQVNALTNMLAGVKKWVR